ncbi:hypothetical protein, partial [Neisseria sicca]|uniref:hypothetical protein n=2 Tax=Neisseria TaxID=482 RepID=UPI001C991402
ENVGLQPFCLGGGFLFRTVVHAGGNPILNCSNFFSNKDFLSLPMNSCLCGKADGKCHIKRR